MLSQEKRIKILEDIEWAKVDIEKGDVYRIKWPIKYVEDCNILLDEIMRLEDKLNEEGKS